MQPFTFMVPVLCMSMCQSNVGYFRWWTIIQMIGTLQPVSRRYLVKLEVWSLLCGDFIDLVSFLEWEVLVTNYLNCNKQSMNVLSNMTNFISRWDLSI